MHTNVVDHALDQLITLKYSKIDLSQNKLLLISNSVLKFDNLTDHAYLSIISLNISIQHGRVIHQ